MYRLFDGVVYSELPLPGIPEAPQGVADIEVVLGYGPVNEHDYDWFHTWHESDGRLVLSSACKRREGGSTDYLLRFPDLADFVVNENLVTCYPHHSCREDTLCHLVLDQVIPRVWAHKGHVVLHASAVQLPNERVVAFLGESGWGKSTLAAALQARGCRLLADDSISLKASNGRIELVPSYTGLRLNQDSVVTLNMAVDSWTAVSHYSDKLRWGGVVAGGGEPVWLDTLYVMTEPGKATMQSINTLAGAELIATLIKRSFLLDVRDRLCAARQMHEIAAVLRALPGIYSLDYPRDYQQLPALCEALTAEDRS